MAGADDLDGLAVEQKLDALFPAVRNFAPGTRHVDFVPAIRAADACRTLPDCRTVAVHAGIPAAENHDVLALEADIRDRLILVPELAVHVGDQVRQRLMDASHVFPGKFATHRRIGSHAEEDRIVLGHEFGKRNIVPDARIQHELHAHALENLAALGDNPFLELEGRNSIGQQTADIRVGVVHDRVNAVAGEYVGRGEPGGPGTDDTDTFAGIDNVRHVRAPALRQRFVGDVLLDVAYRYGADAVVQRARTLAQAILWTDPAADLR